MRWSHMTRRSPALLLRLWIPLLLAVAALLGPGLARAAAPAPDPPSSGAPVPDAAPVHHAKVAAAPRAPVAVPVRKAAVAAATYTPPPVTHAAVVAVAQPTKRVAAPAGKHVARARKHVAQPEIKIIDVPPLRVDVHRGLGAVTRSLHDNSLLLLAGIALLVATFTAASGTTLAVIATRPPRKRR